jgi:hypothetical protein
MFVEVIRHLARYLVMLSLKGTILLNSKRGNRSHLTRWMNPTTPFSEVFTPIAETMGIPSSTPPAFKFDGWPLEPRQTPSELNMSDGDVINVTPVFHRRILRKPVIYLFSPDDVDVMVTLTLSDEWSLEVVYPVVLEVLEDGLQSRIQWNVRTRQDGSLTTLDTSLDVSYLFWEAE